ncbi:hypothetical protein ACE1CI_17955 [Aerosakkonemataceae cyanobacterium BLCC-F50]|uniref:Uncharacterized protein n=1 Tax=Floridaenema flaviceps BLCC-F50 TaxID=3153642 RepID=A0ABV4XU49_9CYAN
MTVCGDRILSEYRLLPENREGVDAAKSRHQAKNPLRRSHFRHNYRHNDIPVTFRKSSSLGD